MDELTYQGISYKDFSEQVGISINTLNMYLYRNSIPSADVAVRMAQVLNVTTEYLVLGTPSQGKASSRKNQRSERERLEISRIVEQVPSDRIPQLLEIVRAYKSAISL